MVAAAREGSAGDSLTDDSDDEFVIGNTSTGCGPRQPGLGRQVGVGVDLQDMRRSLAIQTNIHAGVVAALQGLVSAEGQIAELISQRLFHVSRALHRSPSKIGRFLHPFGLAGENPWPPFRKLPVYLG